MSVFQRYAEITQRQADADPILAYFFNHRVMDGVMGQIITQVRLLPLSDQEKVTLCRAAVGTQFEKKCLLLFAMWLKLVHVEGNPIRAEKYHTTLHAQCLKMIHGKYVNMCTFVTDTITEYVC
jgi:hypothetical protein